MAGKELHQALFSANLDPHLLNQRAIGRSLIHRSLFFCNETLLQFQKHNHEKLLNKVVFLRVNPSKAWRRLTILSSAVDSVVGFRYWNPIFSRFPWYFYRTTVL